MHVYSRAPHQLPTSCATLCFVTGNRAPLGIYIHAAWLIADPTRVDQLENFIRYALAKDNVVFATISEVRQLNNGRACCADCRALGLRMHEAWNGGKQLC